MPPVAGLFETHREKAVGFFVVIRYDTGSWLHRFVDAIGRCYSAEQAPCFAKPLCSGVEDSL